MLKISKIIKNKDVQIFCKRSRQRYFPTSILQSSVIIDNPLRFRIDQSEMSGFEVNQNEYEEVYVLVELPTN